MKAHPYLEGICNADLTQQSGNVVRIATGCIEADGPMAKVGDYCAVEENANASGILAEVISLDADKIKLLPLGSTRHIQMGAKVTRSSHLNGVAFGDAYGGRVVDALGQPIDDAGPIRPVGAASREGDIPKTLDRESPSERLYTGVRAIDALFPIGEGQRIGIFAASGVGKTCLIEQLSQQIECDHCVICLIGERGREVEKLSAMHMKGQHKERFTIVAATSDESASMRVRAADQALGIAEYWRAQGKHVVLFIDSITRLALALREIGLAAGEPPTVRAFTPNIFTAMPRIVERCGCDRNAGSITAIFTILSETDDVDDPIVELMKSLLDGHIVLSRKLAEKGHFPAIDISSSISRLASSLFDDQDANLAREAHKIFAEYDEARPMIESGIYRRGSNAQIDAAIARYPELTRFLQQSQNERAAPAAIRSALAALFAGSVA